jgi:hypothetical protein
MKVNKLVAFAGAGVLAVSLVGCSSCSEVAVSPSVSDLAGGEMLVGGDPGTWSPVMVTDMDNNKTFDLVVGQVGLFAGLPADDSANNIVVESDNTMVVEPIQRTNADGSAGFIAKSVGSATITVMDGFPADGEAQTVQVIKVNVTPYMQSQ